MSILDDILFFANCFSNVEFSFIHRKGNVSAHLLAQWTTLVNWFGPVPISNLPSHISQAFVKDGSKPDLFVSPLFQVEFFLVIKYLFSQKKKKKAVLTYEFYPNKCYYEGIPPPPPKHNAKKRTYKMPCFLNPILTKSSFVYIFKCNSTLTMLSST